MIRNIKKEQNNSKYRNEEKMSEYEYWYEKLKKNKNVEIEDVKREEIEDIKNIKVNEKLSSRERVLDYIRTVENPYMLKINDTLVKITFETNNIEFKQCLNNIVKNNA